MAVAFEETLMKPEGRVLSTLESDGSRRWLYPRLAPGRFLTRRRIVAYLLIVIFTAIPYIPINGKPAMLLDLAHRRFTFFGLTFLPTDTLLLALFMVSFLLSIFFITALFGRVWCGWACPQTVYMEFVYRPVERLFTGRSGRGGEPKNVPGWRMAGMYLAFLLISMFLAHTFLAYFVGISQLRQWIGQSPVNHPASFIIMLVTTGLMMFDFAFFREQTCIIACPYGRFQSVLMDRQSLIISYDPARGEPRGRKVASAQLPVVSAGAPSQTTARLSSPKSDHLPLTTAAGDCIDCSLCVQACPTGIDIRDGLQIECISCAACIDACDDVMERIKRPLGLIRYSSQNAMSGAPKQGLIRPRVIIYMAIVATLLGVMTFLIITRSPLDVTMLRSLGRPFVLSDAGEVENTIRVKLTNRTDQPMHLRFSAAGNTNVRVNASQDMVEIPPSASWTEPVIAIAPANAFSMGGLNVTIRVSGENGLTIDREFRLLGPVGGAVIQPKGAAANEPN